MKIRHLFDKRFKKRLYQKLDTSETSPQYPILRYVTNQGHNGFALRHQVQLDQLLSSSFHTTMVGDTWIVFRYVVE
jgi:hypothetical protein